MTNSGSEITVKEVYERVIALETKFDNVVEDGRKVNARFTFLAVATFLSILVDIGLHLYLHNIEGKL